MLLLVFADYYKCGRYSLEHIRTSRLFIQTIVSVVGIAETITVPFDCLFRLLYI
jgi:hypothetical protein